MAIEDPKVRNSAANPIRPVTPEVPTQAPSSSPAGRPERAPTAEDARGLANITGNNRSGARSIWDTRSNDRPIRIGTVATLELPNVNEGVNRVLEYEPSLRVLDLAMKEA